MRHYIHLLDKITILCVDPGFAGQPYIREMLEKIADAKRIKEENGYHYLIEVDGSCNERTYRELFAAGAECFVAGSTGLFCLDAELERAWDKMAACFLAQTGCGLRKAPA